MKIPSPTKLLKAVKKQLKGMRLIVVLAIIAVLLVGVTSVAAYTAHLQKKKIQATEKVQKKATTPAPKQEQKPAVVVAEEKAPAPVDTQPAPAQKNVAKKQTARTQPDDPRLKPITARILWWGGGSIYCNPYVPVITFGYASVSFLGFAGGELHWQTEADTDGVVNIIDSGSATIAPGQITYDIKSDATFYPKPQHGYISLRVHITSPNDVASEWHRVEDSHIGCTYGQ